MTLHEKQMENFRAAVKFQNSIRAKAKRRFDKIFSAEDLNGLTAKSDYSGICFEKINRFNNWSCWYFINPVFNSDRTKAVDLFFKSQSEDYPEMPQFISDKKQQILDIFTELINLYTVGELELEKNELK